MSQPQLNHRSICSFNNGGTGKNVIDEKLNGPKTKVFTASAENIRRLDLIPFYVCGVRVSGIAAHSEINHDKKALRTASPAGGDKVDKDQPLCAVNECAGG
jgi:hypothetical protein